MKDNIKNILVTAKKATVVAFVCTVLLLVCDIICYHEVYRITFLNTKEAYHRYNVTHNGRIHPYNNSIFYKIYLLKKMKSMSYDELYYD